MRDDDTDDLGPAMGALPPQERQFVYALFDDPGGRGLFARAAKAAGYSASSISNLSRAANKLRHRPRVVRAIGEMAKLEIRNRAPAAVKTVADVMRRGKPADRLKAARTILDRVDPTEHHAVVDVHVREDRQVDLAVRFLEELIELGVPREGLVAHFGYTGISHYEQLLRDKCERERRPYPISKIKTIDGELLRSTSPHNAALIETTNDERRNDKARSKDDAHESAQPPDDH